MLFENEFIDQWEYCHPWTRSYATGNSLCDLKKKCPILALMHKTQLLFGTNCPYRHINAGIIVKRLLSDVWYFTFFSIYFFLGWNYLCLGIEPLFELSILYSYCTNATMYYIILTGVPVCSIDLFTPCYTIYVLDLVSCCKNR
jgi:hypothetical protein